MSGSLVFLSVLVALVAGAVAGYVVASLRAGKVKHALQLVIEGERVRRETETLQAGERAALLEQSEARLRAAFDSLAAESLRANSQTFLQLAKESLGRDQSIAQSALKERETAIAQMVEPLRVALQRTETQVQALERDRREAFTTLRVQIEGLAGGHAQLQRETRNLVTALRRPEVRGRWGEMTLRRVVELAGMAEHCDFTEQLHVVGDDGALRPDMVVHMPESRDLVVDVKTPLDAYLEAIEAPTDEARGLALKRHAQQVEMRVRQLGAKSYWAQFEHSPEFAVLFLPGDQFLGAALAERPELLESALKLGVIIATPSTLIALLKTVAYGWRQSVVADNAATIRELGQELYKRLSTFVGHVGTMGQRLGKAVEAYNSAVGSLERQVLPQARRFPELGVTADAPLAPLEPISQLARTPAAAAAVEDAPAEAVAAETSEIDSGVLPDEPGTAEPMESPVVATEVAADTRGKASLPADTPTARTKDMFASALDAESNRH